VFAKPATAGCCEGVPQGALPCKGAVGVDWATTTVGGVLVVMRRVQVEEAGARHCVRVEVEPLPLTGGHEDVGRWIGCRKGRGPLWRLRGYEQRQDVERRAKIGDVRDVHAASAWRDGARRTN
jgi:hypothetical protein